MTTAPDGAPRRPRSPGSPAPIRRAPGAAADPEQSSSARRPAAQAATTARARGRDESSATGSGSSFGSRLGARLRRGGDAIASLVIPVVMMPVSFFVWYVIISLGGYPGDRAVADLVVALLLTALVHAALLVGILLGVRAVRRRRAAGGVSLAGWVGIVLGALVVVFWELLVSPWIVQIWNRVVGA